MDKGDIGALVGGILVGGATATIGLGPAYIIGGTILGALGGHNIADRHHYSLKHKYK